MTTIIIQKHLNSKEIRSVKHAAILSDTHNIFPLELNELQNHLQELKSGMPVGTVEFVRKVLFLLNIPEPYFDFFNEKYQKFLKRKIQKMTKKEFLQQQIPAFIKPTKIKQFTGFVYDGVKIDDEFNKSDDDTEIYVSEIINLKREYRYYIRNNIIQGYARYDDKEDEEIIEPNIVEINELIQSISTKICHPYVLDFGVTDDNETVFIEFNDFWAIGHYQNSIPDKLYLEMLIERWNFFM